MRPQRSFNQFGCFRCVFACARPRAVRARAAAAVREGDVALADEDAAKLRPVDKVVSARVIFDDEGEPDVQYLAKWQVCHTMAEHTPHLRS
jgi:hypothetical protein